MVTAAWIQEVEKIGHNGRCISINIGKVPHLPLAREQLVFVLLVKVQSHLVEVVDEA